MSENQPDAQFILSLFHKPLRVLGFTRLIIRRNNCIYVTLGTCYSVWMTMWYAGWNSNMHTR